MALEQNERVSITLHIEGEKAKNELAILEKGSRDLEKAIKEVPKGSVEWAELNKKIHENKDAQTKLRAEIGITGLTYRQLQAEVKLLTKELTQMTPGTTDFIEKSKRLNEVTARAKEVKGQMNGINDSLDDPNKRGLWGKMVAGFNSVGGAFRNAFGIAAGISIASVLEAVVNFGKKSVLAAAEASDAFGGITKTTGLTTEEVLELNKAIGQINTRTAQEDLLKIAQIGGQIGVTKDEMLGFVKSVDMAVVALGDEFSGGADEVATKLGVLSKIFKETKDLKAGEAIDGIGSAINELGAAGSATGPVVADFATRLGSLGNLAPQISQTLGLGAAFQELGLTSEIAASGLKNILNGAALATGLYADQIGITEQKFKALINSSPNDVILELAKSFKGLPTTEVVRQMDALGIKSNEAKSVMSLLANQTELVTKRQDLAKQAMEDAATASAQLASGYKGVSEEQKKTSSLTQEFNVMNNTAAAELQKAGKAVDSLKMQLGMYLIPVLVEGTKGFTTMVGAVSALPKFIQDNQKAFTALAVAILALNGNNIKAAASAIAHAAAETSRAIVARATAIAQNLQLAMLIALEAADKKATTASYLSIAAEKARTIVVNTVTGAKTALRAIMAALTLENIKNTASSTAAAVAEKTRALVTNTVTGAQTTLRAITAALTLENIRSTASTVAHTVAEKARTLATNAVALAQGLLNAVLKANPIGVVITLVAAIAAGFMKWYDSSQTLRAGMAGLWSAVKAVGTVIADVWSALVAMDFSKVSSILANGAKDIAKAFTKGYNDQIASEAPKVIKTHKDIVDTKAQNAKKAADKAAADEKAAADKAAADALFAANNSADTITKTQQRELDKRKAAKEKQLEEYAKAEEKYDAKVLKDREKALELAAQMEAENDQAVAETSLKIEESKIQEKARKRKKEITDSTADADVKANLIKAIDANALLATAKVQEEYRVKKQKADEEAAKKKLESERFILDQEGKALAVYYDFQEMEAKGNAGTLSGIKKQRLDEELELTKKHLQAEMLAEKAHASTIATSTEEEAKLLKQIDDRYNRENLLAFKETADKKLEIDRDLREKKVDNLRRYADNFKGMLNGNLTSLINSTIEALSVTQKANQTETEAMIEKFEKYAAAAQAAVNFLNGLAQKRAQRNIEIAKQELAERTAVLEREIAITEAMYEASSDYLTSLKDSETDKINALQAALTSDTESELDKRAAASKFYSDQVQALKEAEEAKITAMQRMANLAKTDDEKQAIEAKIVLAKQEAAEKIRLAEEEMNRNIADNLRLVELQRVLTSETTDQEQKRSAVQESYSILLQNLKATEEARITDLHRQANEAKTSDEKQAIEAKIALAEKEKETKIRLMEEERDKKTETLEDLDSLTQQLTEKQLADAKEASERQILLASDEAEQKADFKADLEETIAAENRKARATEQAEKIKAFKAQKKADIATALITGALAVLKALANFFPLNIILAATAAVVTGVQIAKIKNQPEPTFARDGAIIEGGKHGARYSDGGIALIDRASGREVGEMEGGEAIISADQTEANMPLIQEMFRNARSPGMRKKAIASEPGLPAFRDGGMFESPYYAREMYLFGSKKKKAAAAAAAAEAEAAAAQAEADAYLADMPSADTSAYGGIDGSEPNPSTAESNAAFAASQKQGETQLKLLEGIIEAVDNGTEFTAEALAMLSKAVTDSAGSTTDALQKLGSEVSSLRGAIDSVRGAVLENVGATRGVENAVYNTNANGILQGIMSRISNLQ